MSSTHHGQIKNMQVMLQTCQGPAVKPTIVLLCWIIRVIGQYGPSERSGCAACCLCPIANHHALQFLQHSFPSSGLSGHLNWYLLRVVWRQVEALSVAVQLENLEEERRNKAEEKVVETAEAD